MAIRIGKPKKAVGREEIAELERVLGYRLPRDYHEFLLQHNGAVPENNVFPVGADNGSGINGFIPLHQIERERASVEAEIPPSSIPIAWAEGGNYILLDLAGGGPVMYWDHEEPEKLTRLGHSVTDFLGRLEPFDVSTIELKPGQVKSVWIDPDLLRQEYDLTANLTWS